MSQIYSNPKRANESSALLDVETFYMGDGAQWVKACAFCDPAAIRTDHAEHVGWYRLGGMPDGEPKGPFATEAEAVADAQSDGDASKHPA